MQCNFQKTLGSFHLRIYSAQWGNLSNACSSTYRHLWIAILIKHGHPRYQSCWTLQLVRFEQMKCWVFFRYTDIAHKNLSREKQKYSIRCMWYISSGASSLLVFITWLILLPVDSNSSSGHRWAFQCHFSLVNQSKLLFLVLFVKISSNKS